MSVLSYLRTSAAALLALLAGSSTLTLVRDPVEEARWSHVGGGWLGGDGSYPVRLPDGRVAWLFGDSYVRAPDGSRRLVHGSMVAESAGGLARAGSTGTGDLIPVVVPGTVVWPSAGFVEGGRLRVFGEEVDVGGGGFVSTGRRYLTTFSLPGLVRVGDPAPTYSGGTSWGHAALATSAYVYVFGNLQVSGWVNRTYLARFPLGGSAGPWQFWDGRVFQPDPVGAAAEDAATGGLLDAKLASVVRLADGRLAAYTIAPFGSAVQVRTASSPTGPWGAPRTALRLSAADASAGAYLPRLLRSGSGVRGAYSVTGSPLGVHFIRTG